MVDGDDGRAVCCGPSAEADVVRGLGIADPALAQGVVTDVVYLRRGCVERHGRCIGINFAIFSSGVFSHFGIS
jgi:hypothetical protein